MENSTSIIKASSLFLKRTEKRTTIIIDETEAEMRVFNQSQNNFQNTLGSGINFYANSLKMKAIPLTFQ